MMAAGLLPKPFPSRPIHLLFLRGCFRLFRSPGLGVGTGIAARGCRRVTKASLPCDRRVRLRRTRQHGSSRCDCAHFIAANSCSAAGWYDEVLFPGINPYGVRGVGRLLSAAASRTADRERFPTYYYSLTACEASALRQSRSGKSGVFHRTESAEEPCCPKVRLSKDWIRSAFSWLARARFMQLL
jgi:hypothetical protein